MEIPSKYNPQETESKWYEFWTNHRLFHSEPDQRKPYTIVIPPPNVTGILHMGHMLNNTIQDVLIRRAKLMGFNALWVPGTDHASIATEAKVVAKLKSEGIEKNDLSREDFLKHAWAWTDKHGGIILQQLKKLGAACDWERTVFTMDEARSESVIDVFIDLYEKGLIYRGVRMVNWDPAALTAISDDEVIYKELHSKLYYIRYKIEGTADEWVTIATTRPETILGDTAVCINPNDERFIDLKGKRVLVPLINRSIPIIEDEYVDMEFGTGCLKITPSHDINDYNLGLKHKLDSIDIFNPNGTLNENAQLYVGEDRFIVREKITKELQEKGYIVKIEDYINKVGFSERTDVIIEPKLSLQWFLNMKEMSKPALEVVMDDTIQFHPQKFKNTYRHWMENCQDWCISRQLWWGHRIPVYYLPNKELVVAKSDEEALQKAKTQYGLDLQITDLKQDEDVLDTWFSSWLWPISVFDGIRYPDNSDIKYYYPSEVLVTAPEILFFWVARMIMAGEEYRRDIPFRHVYLTGIVRDKLGRKMSKSLGNSPDPIMLMEKYGADGVRVGMLLTSPAGNDLPFEESLCEQGRNFSNKVWNALRLVTGWKQDATIEQPESDKLAISWFENKLNETIEIINDHFDKYRISDALMAIYKLIWDDFCSWYLEMIKPGYQLPIPMATYEATISIFDSLMRIVHPFMPFLTEEIWHRLTERKDNESIMNTEMPSAKTYDKTLLQSFEYTQEVIIKIREIRTQKNIPNKEPLELIICSDNKLHFDSIIAKLTNLNKIEYSANKPENVIGFIARSTEFFIPIGDNINKEDEIERLEKELVYTKGFLDSVMKKLGNERFVSNAPDNVLAIERKKRADAESKIAIIEEQLKGLR